MRKFILVRDDGGFFKVHAEFMVWYFVDKEICAQALWTFKALKKTLRSLMADGKTISDPDYQT